LKKIIEYCEFHVKEEPDPIPKPLPSSNLSDLVGEFDAKFIDIEDLEVIFEIIMAANYLDIKSLLDLSCAKIATLIRGKTPEEIRKTFNIVNDFTPEEEA
jgi:S-phase kinase-associated protein 1